MTRRAKLAAAAVLAALAAAALLLAGSGSRPTEAETYARLGIDPAPAAGAVLAEGEAWQPAADERGYALAAENGSFRLRIRPKDGSIEVEDRRSGYSWSSSPSREELALEKVKGLPLANLQSPFVLTLVRTEGKDQTIRESLNSLSKGMRLQLLRTADGVEVRYSFPDRKLGFAVRYALTDAGLKASIPAAGLVEQGGYAVFSLDLLPFFGAATAAEDGYLFVPDGPGGLIRFQTGRAGQSKGYAHQVYGAELARTSSWTRDAQLREDIAYPAFGLKRGDHAFVAVLTEGEGAAVIAATPPGVKSSRYSVHSSQLYREEYLYRMSRLAAPTKAVQKQRLDVDREVEYRFLNGGEADYAGMAASYRDWLIAEARLGEPLKPAEHVPLQLQIMGGNYEKAFGRIRYVAATTFGQAAGMMRSLREKGVAAARIVYYGWQNRGDYDTEKRFPIEPALGGEDAARSFLADMEALGTKVDFYEDFLWVDEASGASGKNDAVRAIDGTAFTDEGWFLAKPAFSAAAAADTVDRLRELGASGIVYGGLGDTIFNDYEADGIRSRAFTAEVYGGMLDYARRQLGSASVKRGNAYALGHVDAILELPSDSSHDFMIDETVPFYPIALHGYVPYSFGPANLRDDDVREFLRAIEYGALPSFFVTHDDSRKLKETPSDFLYSSRFDKWEERIAQEYARFDELAGVLALRIVGHQKLGPERYETTYEDGTRVVVDYAAGDYAIEKGGGA
ncbi:DUF5696 domain-containing protein [Paenibacillus sp. B01]|uniref:DUF5696 domain-containing protein n=1 Tax=Paenibacillus sp. B01 TaxID=2660554 RepID=UPI00129B1D0F|nr:DUF5696 domain-containing protein [Paenibacillus sp. B01]QGG55669.1 hypothetical protein GE073_08875 [Paenibacillus sp. B01]